MLVAGIELFDVSCVPIAWIHLFYEVLSMKQLN